MKRLQRLRANSHLRDLMASTEFNLRQLIQPLFVVEGLSKDEPVKGLRGVFRQGKEGVLKQIEADVEAGVRHFILFHVPKEKKSDHFRFDASSEAIAAIKKRFGTDIQLWVDTCLCSMTEHGHCCVFNKDGCRDHEATLMALSEGASHYVAAGADGVSPSDMMDGRVGAIRQALDQAGFLDTPIMSYSTKFASQFYGPFRGAADSSPKFGDRSSYQIDVRSRTDALASSCRCAEEGADLLMVKPGMSSIDLIRPIFEATGRPVGAYQVSGEFASLVLLAENGLIHFEKALLESWQVLKRAGSQYIITYGARMAKTLGIR